MHTFFRNMLFAIFSLALLWQPWFRVAHASRFLPVTTHATNEGRTSRSICDSADTCQSHNANLLDRSNLSTPDARRVLVSERFPTITDRSSDKVTYDNYTLIVNGERLFIWSGEFHPFRLPSPDLYLDVLQKIKAIGYNAVSFYVDWALVEGHEGSFRFEGIFGLEKFCEAAKQAGIYLIARPGPYINAEVSGGGFPGWLQRINGTLRTSSEPYLSLALKYEAEVTKILAPFQIESGGPVILFQVENEYTGGNSPLDASYMTALGNTLRENGVVVPTSFNDAYPAGNFPSGKPGGVDLYGWDGYPFGYGPGLASCDNPSAWPQNALPSKLFDRKQFLDWSPNTPFWIPEFQGSTVQGWGDAVPQTACAALLGPEFERLVYKEMLGSGVRMINMYMTFGGTNWGNLGFPDTTTSYDEGAAITEDRLVSREKYSELKLQANFVKSSPAFWTSVPRDATTGDSVSTKDLTVRISDDVNSPSKFYFVRHTDYASLAATSYTLTVETTRGQLKIPQIGNTALSLNGRDHKIHVVDYAVGSKSLIYSTAEVFSTATYGNKSVVILYGGMPETHEFAVDRSLGTPSGPGARSCVTQTIDDMIVVQWNVTAANKVLRFGDSLEVWLLWRNSAYSLWSLDSGQGTVIVSGGYLMRNATIEGDRLALTGDLNATTTLSVLAAPTAVKRVSFNGSPWREQMDDYGHCSATVHFRSPKLAIPSLSSLQWNYIDSLPEIRRHYGDQKWVECSKRATNSSRPLSSVVSLYSGDYGFHAGHLIYRAHFKANGQEGNLSLTTQGGNGYGHTAWLDDKFLGSFVGAYRTPYAAVSYPIGSLAAGESHVITIVVDNMGYNMNTEFDQNGMKTPRGIVDYSLDGHDADSLVWNMTGNLGGEDYLDAVRGPLNEGGTFAERQGWHQPGAPVEKWEKSSPLEGISKAGIAFYTSTFDLNIPDGYDVPLAFVLDGKQGANFRCQLFVNGYQFGKYVNNLGPQHSFPVPQGILNYHGQNSIALTLWSLDDGGASISSLELVKTAVIATGYGVVAPVPQPAWTQRAGAY